MTSPEVTVIIPTYNRASLICTAIESAAGDGVEVIVVDDGSTDETFETLKKYQILPNFHYIKQNNKGAASARNVGINKATSPYIAFLDSDDFYTKDSLNKRVEILKNYSPNKGFIFGDFNRIINDVLSPQTLHQKSDLLRAIIDDNTIEAINPNAVKLGLDIYDACCGICAMHTPTVVFAKKLVEKAGLFNESMERCEDWEWMLRVIPHADIFYDAGPVATVRFGANNSLSSSALPSLKAHLSFLKSSKSLLKVNSTYNDLHFSEMNHVYEKLSRALIDVGDNAAARSICKDWRCHSGLQYALILTLFKSLCPSNVVTYLSAFKKRILNNYHLI